jgi:hypothetical protein
MARRKLTLPIASQSGIEKTKSIAITRSGWRNFEKAFGKPLPQSTCDEILKLTEDFVYWARSEVGAEPLQPARDRVIAWKRLADTLQEEFWKPQEEFSKPSAPSGRKPSPKEMMRRQRSHNETLFYAKYLVSSNFSDARFQRPGLFGALGGVLTSFSAACKMALAHMDNSPGWRTGEAWENWVRNLTRLLDRAHLPTGVRTDDLGEQSAFTKSVAMLQKYVPSRFRRHTHSLSALAKAIQRARAQRPRRDK